MNPMHFKLAFSYCYEKAMYKFFSRLNTLVSFALLLSAMAVVTDAAATFSAWVVAALTAFQFAYAPANRAAHAKTQYLVYLNLFETREQHTPESVNRHLSDLNATASDTIDILSHPARLSALALMGYTGNNLLQTPERPMHWYEKLAARFTGEWPEFRN